MPSSSRPPDIWSSVVAILASTAGMTELVAQHHVSDPEPFGAAQQRGGQRPRLQRVDAGHAGAVHVVVEPQRADAEFLAAVRAVQDLGEGEAHLRDVDPDVQRRSVTA